VFYWLFEKRPVATDRTNKLKPSPEENRRVFYKCLLQFHIAKGYRQSDIPALPCKSAADRTNHQYTQYETY